MNPMTHHALRPCTALAAGSLLGLLACSSSSSSPAGATDAGNDARVTPEGGGTVAIHASGFDQSCQKSSDCVLVEDAAWSATDPCCGHGCPSAAINVADQSKYSAALSQAVAQCMASGNVECGVDCAAIEAFCNAGKCDVCMGVACADAGAGDAAAE
jgi:hypothetical protein